MAATDVMSASPLTPGQNATWSSFEDYLDIGSPIESAIATPSAISMTNLTALASPNPSISVKTENSSATSLPPAPGSPPEILFRYYLAAELRKIGISAEDTVIDKYVIQHYDSFTRAMERHQAQASEMVTAGLAAGNARESKDNEQVNGVQAFRQQASNDSYLSGRDDSTTSELNSIDPQMMELNTLNTSFGSPSAQMTKMSINESMSNAHDSPSSTSSISTVKQDQSMNMDEDDIMSEEDEEEEDSKQGNASSKGKAANRPLRTIEETPIEGSIMGPSNELRPDPETYHTLTSKEKRQLRNKISARNFRTRRKEHIAQLEQQVADRDTLIEGLRQQLAKVSLKNKELQEEVRSLKTKSISSTDVSRIIDALQKSAGAGQPESTNNSVNIKGPPSSTMSSVMSSSSMSDGSFSNSRPLTPSLSSTSSPLSMSPRPSVALAMPNTRKDIPGTSVGASGVRSFWGGVGSTANGNNFMSVHTVLVPSLRLPASSNLSIEGAKEKKMNGSSNVHDKMQTLIESTEMLSIGEKIKSATLNADAQEEVKNPRKTLKRCNSMSDSDINAALVTLIDGENAPPPSYTEAVGQTNAGAEDSMNAQQSTTSSLVGEGRIHHSILAALEKAIAKPVSSNVHGSEANEKCGILHQPQLDIRRLQALLDGRARLALVDVNGQPWHDDCQPSTTQRSTLEVGSSVNSIPVLA